MKFVFVAIFSLLLINVAMASCESSYRRKIDSIRKYSDKSIEELRDIATAYQIKRSKRKHDVSTWKIFNIGREKQSIVKAYIALIDAENQYGENLKAATRDVSIELALNIYEATVQGVISYLNREELLCPDGNPMTYEELVSFIASQI